MNRDSASYTNSFGFQWNIHARTQLDSVSGLPISRKRFFETTNWPEHMNGQRILEAGSGAGRFTEILLTTDATVYSFDASHAVEANRANNGNHRNLHLFRADIFNIPKDIGLFNKVICLGVLQHTPEPKRAFMELVKFVKPGGEIVIDIYKKTFVSLLQWKYLLRPVLKRIPDAKLYGAIRNIVPAMLPFLITIKKILGSVGARLFPIVEYSNLGLTHEMNKEWAVLDTFDMYSPAYDKPQTLNEVRRWFKEAGLIDIDVRYSFNGIVAKGKSAIT